MGADPTATAAEIAVCPVCGIEVPPERGLFDYFDHLTFDHGGKDE